MYRTSALKKFWWVIILMLIALAIPGAVLAQSSVDLVVHYVEGVPSQEQIAYDVNVYLSVVTSAGNPIKDLNAENFTVSEDSQQVAVAGVELAKDEPINLVLLMDTSGSMVPSTGYVGSG